MLRFLSIPFNGRHMEYGRPLYFHPVVLFIFSSCGFWATVCKTVRPMLSVRCPVLSCLSVTFVHCGQTVGRIKTKLGIQTALWMKTPLGTEVDLRTGHIVLDGFPALRERGTAPPPFRPMSIVATVARLSYC